MKVTEDLVNRFLAWPVPASVHPDGTPGQPGRTGTNLLTAIEARAMLEHVLAPVQPTALNHRDTFNLFDEQTARMERVIYIAGALGDGHDLADELKEFLEEVDDVDIVRLWGTLPDSVAEALREDDIEGLCEWLVQKGHLGFLLQMSTPIMRYDKFGSSFSWGHYRRHWVYGETLEAALHLGFAWVAQQRASEQEAPRSRELTK